MIKSAGVIFHQEKLLLFHFSLHRQFLYFVNHLDERFDVKMRIDTLGECHCTGVPCNLLNHCLIYMGFCEHGNTGVACIMRCVVEANMFHQRQPVAVIIVPVDKAFLIFGM